MSRRGHGPIFWNPGGGGFGGNRSSGSGGGRGRRRSTGTAESDGEIGEVPAASSTVGRDNLNTEADLVQRGVSWHPALSNTPVDEQLQIESARAKG